MLCRIEPASGAASPFFALAKDGLGLVRDPRALRTRVSVTGNRLSVSAIESIHEHDHERPSSAAPHPQSPAGAAFLPVVAPFRMRTGLRMADSLSRAGQPSFHGSGVDGVGGNESRSLVVRRPPTAIARGRSFAPTRSTRTPHVARRDERRPETTSSVDGGALHASPTVRLTRRRSRAIVPPDLCCRIGRRKGRTARSPAKVFVRCRTRGAFHCRTAPPFRGPLLPPQPVPRLWMEGAGAFSIPGNCPCS